MYDGGRVQPARDRAHRQGQSSDLGSGQERQAEDQRIALARQFAARGARFGAGEASRETGAE